MHGLQHSSDIVVRFKLQIDNSYNSAEVFLPDYCVFGKDRCEGAGGVLYA